jgi:hypothetical protein
MSVLKFVPSDVIISTALVTAVLHFLVGIVTPRNERDVVGHYCAEYWID